MLDGLRQGLVRAWLSALLLLMAVSFHGETRASRARQSSKPPVPYEDVGACPFEGCVYRAWTANAEVKVRSDRKESAPQIYTIRRGEQVTALTGVVVTVKPGRVEFPKVVTLRTGSGPVKIEPGQILYLLTYRGEGFFKAWFEGRLYDQLDGTIFYNGVCDFDPERCTGKIVERMQSIWWVQVRSRLGQTGWTNETGKFDGKDALGAKAPRSNTALHPTGARS